MFECLYSANSAIKLTNDLKVDRDDFESVNVNSPTSARWAPGLEQIAQASPHVPIAPVQQQNRGANDIQ